MIFYHNEEQRKLAEETRNALVAKTGKTIYTEIEPAGTFYPAEDYHQKYYLQHYPRVFGEYMAIYPDFEELVRATAVARLNGYVGGYGSADTEKEIEELGLSPESRRLIDKIIARGLAPGCPISSLSP